MKIARNLFVATALLLPLFFAFGVKGDDARGFLFVSCHLGGSPNSIFEGIAAAMGFTDFWSGVAPVAGVDGNRTIFHLLSTED